MGNPGEWECDGDGGLRLARVFGRLSVGRPYVRSTHKWPFVALPSVHWYVICDLRARDRTCATKGRKVRAIKLRLRLQQGAQIHKPKIILYTPGRPKTAMEKPERERAEREQVDAMGYSVVCLHGGTLGSTGGQSA